MRGWRRMVLREFGPGRTVIVVLACVVATNCAVTLISPYDQTTDQDVTALQKAVDGLLDFCVVACVGFDTMKQGCSDLTATWLKAACHYRSKYRASCDRLSLVTDQITKLAD